MVTVGIAEYLAEKYQSQLAWNVDEQEWYKYGSITKGIWTCESAELIGQSVISEVKAIANQIARASNKRDNARRTVKPHRDVF